MLIASNVSHGFSGQSTAEVLSEVSLAIEAGERIAIVGQSGAGKSTLLYCLAGIISPSQGVVEFDGHKLSQLSPDERAQIRLRNFGFVFQFAELVPELSLRENVELPLRMLGWRSKEYARRAAEILERLDIASVSDRRPTQVSGGQAQRCALARAVASSPRILFADEPTGALDATTGSKVLAEMLRLAEEGGSALVVVTHDRSLAMKMDSMVELVDGRATCSAHVKMAH